MNLMQGLNALYEGFCLFDQTWKVSFWNRVAEEITGFSPSEVQGRSCADGIFLHLDEEGQVLCETDRCPLRRVLRGGVPVEEKLFLRHRHGHRVEVLARLVPLTESDSQIQGICQAFVPSQSTAALSERVRLLEKYALLDTTTGLPNRRYLESTLGARLQEKNHYGWSLGALYIDIDHFKEVNDRYGHEVGDRVLRMVSDSLISGLRVFDTVGRWGGEEFLVLASDVNAKDLIKLGERFRLLVESSSMPVESERLSVTLSVGGAMSRPGDTPESLLARADRCMYEAKSRGRNRVSMSPEDEEDSSYVWDI